MKIVHIIRSLIVNSGVSVFAAEVAGAQAEQGHDVYLRYTWKPDYPVSPKVDCKSFKSLDELGFVPDIVHIHAFWSMDMVRAMSWCRHHKVPYIVSPHGGLMPRVLKKGWIKKHIFYWFFLRKNLQRAKAIHCTGEGESAAVLKLGVQAPIVVAPLGCHLPPFPIAKTRGDIKTVLFLSRIGEEKGLVYLLDAWKLLDNAGWRLILAGPDWRGFRAVLERKINQEQITDIEFTGAADVEMKDALYRQADLFVLPSPMENFSMVVLDALAYGVPVVCTRGTPWQYIEERKCGWWVEPNSASAIANALREYRMMRSEDQVRLGHNARRLAAEFDWRKVEERLAKSYEWLKNGGGVDNDL